MSPLPTPVVELVTLLIGFVWVGLLLSYLNDKDDNKKS